MSNLDSREYHMASPNRLIHETSLYLKQHANNPVDWYPWGSEALSRAKELNKPIFLSIGYSACHWCHVMEHESFEDETTARIMNERFVCIKVDREERPDLDTIYMNSLQVLTREGGGWPLSVFLTPELTPFYAGTYYPPDERYGASRPSFKRLLLAIHEAWTNRRDHVQEVGRNVVGYLQGMSRLEPDAELPNDELLKNAFNSLRRSFDPTNGGFGSAPKFPHALELKLLLRLSRRLGDGTAVHMVRLTLEKMACGGMYDQVGGGFHRYSVDERWLVPHFEKMLYDNALLATAYLEAWQLTREPLFERIVRETLDYVLREMTLPQGGFFSTQDADSEGEEGKFYVWTEVEIEAILGSELAAMVRRVWGTSLEGNFEGKNILCRARSDEADAELLGIPLEVFRQQLDEAKRKLYEVRAKRVWPGRDEKILAAWNGLMISAFAQAGAVLGETRYLNAGIQAAEFAMKEMRTPEGRLFRTIGAGQPAKLNGYLEDYAFLADALVSLYEATFEVRWLNDAAALADVMLRQFADASGPGFFFVAADHEELIARTKDLHDGSTPSGNAVAVTVLLRLAKLLDRRDFAAKAEETLRGYRTTMAEHPAAAGQMLIALDLYLGPAQELVILGGSADPGTKRVLMAIRGAFQPNRVIAFHDPATGSPPANVPLFEGKTAVKGQPTVYVCENYSCQTPLVGVEAVEEAFVRNAKPKP